MSGSGPGEEDVAGLVMSPPEPRRPGTGAGGPGAGGYGGPGAGSPLGDYPRRYGRYAGLLGVLIVVLIVINTALTKPTGVRGIEPGRTVPPFAVPLALGTLTGAADVATHANDGAAGRVPACAERGAQILNICELYEHAPVVLALFVDGGSCPAVLSQMQALAARFPGVGFAGVAIKGEREPLLKLMRERGLTRVQVGLDSEGTLTSLYEMASCPQVSFVLPGGVVQSPALLTTPSQAVLRTRVSELQAAAKASGWRAPKSADVGAPAP
jgi:hypothetical protein